MLLLLAVCYFFCCPNKAFNCEDISAVTHIHLTGVLCILSLEHFSDVWCESSSLININNKMKSQTKKGDETLNCPHKAFDNNCQAVWQRRSVQKILWLIAQQWGLNYSSVFFFLWPSLDQMKELQCALKIFHGYYLYCEFRKICVMWVSLFNNVNTVSLSAMKMWMHTVLLR